jgi:hypothetical protein
VCVCGCVRACVLLSTPALSSLPIHGHCPNTALSPAPLHLSVHALPSTTAADHLYMPCMHSLTRRFNKLLGSGMWFNKHIREPGEDDEDYIAELMIPYAALGFPGCIASLDGVHIPWERAPDSARSWYCGAKGHPTVRPQLMPFLPATTRDQPCLEPIFPHKVCSLCTERDIAVGTHAHHLSLATALAATLADSVQLCG